MHILYQSLGLIKKAYKERRRIVKIPRTKLILKILELFYNEGFIKGFFLSEDFKKIIVFLKYYENKPLIKDFKIFSSPRKQIFVSANFLLKFLNTNGLFVLSTSYNGLIFSNRLFRSNLKNNKRISGKILFQLYI